MKLVHRSFLGLALTSILAACSGSGGESTGTADAAEEQVASDGTEAMTASVQSTQLGNVVFSSVSSQDPSTAVTQLASAMPLYPAGCVTEAKDPTNPAVVDVTFTDCTGPFGLVHLDGELIVTLSAGAGGALNAQIAGDDLTANGHAIDFDATARITVSGATRTVDWQGNWTATDDKGDTLAHTSNLTIVVDTSTSCVTENGTAVTTVAKRVVDTTITGFEVCRDADGTAGCPTGKVEHVGKTSGKTVTVDFNGSDEAAVTGPEGYTFDVPLVCGG
jgi:hypothetical protein